MFEKLNEISNSYYKKILDYNKKVDNLIKEPQSFFVDDISFLFYYTSQYAGFLAQHNILKETQEIVVEKIRCYIKEEFKDNTLNFVKFNKIGSTDLFLIYNEYGVIQINTSKKKILFYNEKYEAFILKRNQNCLKLTNETFQLIIEYFTHLNYQYNDIPHRKSKLKTIME